MKALYFKGNQKLKIKEIPRPKPGPGEVIIKMRSAGICGSDLLIYKPPDPPPYVSGHEGAGIVEEIGRGVLDIKVCDRVAIYHHHGCGKCTLCKMGLYMQCYNRQGLNWHKDGCDSDYFKVEEKFCLKLPDGLNYDDGAIIGCAGGTAYSAVKKMDLSGRTSFALFGTGPVGLSILMVAKVYGVKPIVVDILKDRLDFAVKFGAIDLIDASSCDPVEAIMELTGGKGADRIMIASGSSTAQAQAVKSVSANGRIGFVGMGAKDNRMDMDHFIRRQATAVGSYVCPRNDYPEMVEFLVENNIHFSDMVTRRFSLKKAQEAFSLFSKGATGKFMFKWDS